MNISKLDLGDVGSLSTLISNTLVAMTHHNDCCEDAKHIRAEVYDSLKGAALVVSKMLGSEPPEDGKMEILGYGIILGQIAGLSAVLSAEKTKERSERPKKSGYKSAPDVDPEVESASKALKEALEKAKSKKHELN